MDNPLYQHKAYTVTRAAGRLVIHHDGHSLPDAPCTLAEAIALVDDYARCEWCGGEGVVTCDMCKGNGQFITKDEKGRFRINYCVDCKGSGWTLCPRCGGDAC